MKIFKKRKNLILIPIFIIKKNLKIETKIKRYLIVTIIKLIKIIIMN